jgi:hypothetical protein
MITNGDILKVFRLHVQTDTRVSVRQIHEIVENNGRLTREDWMPHPAEARRSCYPSWKRKVQAALHTLKIQGGIRHFPRTHEYVFTASSCS